MHRSPARRFRDLDPLLNFPKPGSAEAQGVLGGHSDSSNSGERITRFAPHPHGESAKTVTPSSCSTGILGGPSCSISGISRRIPHRMHRHEMETSNENPAMEVRGVCTPGRGGESRHQNPGRSQGEEKPKEKGRDSVPQETAAVWQSAPPKRIGFSGSTRFNSVQLLITKTGHQTHDSPFSTPLALFRAYRVFCWFFACAPRGNFGERSA